MSSPNPLTPPPLSHLPNELIYYIIDCLIPEDNKAIAIPSSDPITKTLLSLAQTSHLIYPIAMRLLYSHCLYIDSFRKVVALHSALHLHHLVSQSPRVPENLRQPPHGPQAPHLQLAQHGTSLFLKPFAINHTDFIPQLGLIRNVLEYLAPYLQRLVFSMPSWMRINTYYECVILEHDPLFADIEFPFLEVLCCVRDNLALHRDGGILRGRNYLKWHVCPRLRVLSLFAPGRDPVKPVGLAGAMPSLERLLLVEYGEWNGVEIKNAYHQRKQEEEARQEKQLKAGKSKDGEGNTQRPWRKLEIVRVEAEGKDMSRGMQAWNDDDALQLRNFLAPSGIGADRNEKCSQWVQERFLAGDETL